MVMKRLSRTLRMLLVILLFPVAQAGRGFAEPPPPREDDYYRIVSIATSQASTPSRSENWKPGDGPEGIALEVSGIAVLDDGRLGVSIRKGEVWILNGVYEDPPTRVTYQRFASGLHEPLGLLEHDGALLSVQRTELTSLRDLDGDGVADQYKTLAAGWGVTGNYHEYAYGPKRDGQGNLWLTLNIGLGLQGGQAAHAIVDPVLGVRQGRWRGWGMMLPAGGELVPVCTGMRSPSGLGANAEGDMFYTDQQGNWVATNALHHMRPGVFFHHPEALASMGLPQSPVSGIEQIPNDVPLPVALENFPQMKPPAVWFPYKKMGQSTTDILLDASDGAFGPFAGQLLVGEFTQAAINRVFLEKVDGEYQGACFPFRRGLASAVLRLAQGQDGSVFVGLTNRGWSSLGSASYGLQRLVWTGQTPFEILEMRAQHDSFELVFTQPVDPASASDVNSYALSSYTYRYQEAYGSDEIDNQSLIIQDAQVSADGLRVRLRVAGLREHYVHELAAHGVRNQEGQPLLHSMAYYTLNRIPVPPTPRP